MAIYQIPKMSSKYYYFGPDHLRVEWIEKFWNHWFGYGPNHIIPKKRFQELINKVTALEPYFSKHNIYQPWWLQPKQTVYLEKAINFNQFRKKIKLLCYVGLWLTQKSKFSRFSAEIQFFQ